MSQPSTDFGFKKVSSETKATLVKDLFDKVAGRYDLMNDLMSLGLHRLWKKEFIKRIPAKPAMHLLDLAGGTGDIALGILARYAYLRPSITVCDPSLEMLTKGKEKSFNKNLFKDIEWIEASAEQLPFPDESMDICTMAFGLRNVTERNRALDEIYRVLKPGGCFLCLEFSKVHPQLRSLYDLYSFSVIPQLGKWVAKDQAAYEYLVESIAAFPSQDQVVELFQAAGFMNVHYTNLTHGVVAIHEGWKK